MLGQQEQDEPANNENYRNCRDGDQSLMCDLKDPICRKKLILILGVNVFALPDVTIMRR
jgi:hypothetical protein